MGAWIEILMSNAFDNTIMSLPLWERGLKSFVTCFGLVFAFVAPLVGAWIEMYFFVDI